MQTQTRPFDLIPPRVTLDEHGTCRPHVPRRFRDRVVLHVVTGRLSEELARYRMPTDLILGVQGPPGEGKSWQTRLSLAEVGVGLVRLSASHLSSRWEGEPVQLLLDAYRFAATQPRVALLIDDLDTGLASIRDNTTYTVNSQLLAGTLMNLCDDPEHVAGARVNRTPIIVTGNDLSTLYQPLTRFGRMSLFTWEPTTDDRVEIVRRVFAETPLTRHQLESLAALRHGPPHASRPVPVAFYRVLRTHLLRERLIRLLPEEAADLRAIEDLIVQQLEESPPLRSFDEIYDAAQGLCEQHQLERFLEVAA